MVEEFSASEAATLLQSEVLRVDGKPRLEVDIDGRRHTVDIRPIYEFERDIVDDLVEPSIDTSISGGAVPIKGKWIHGWLNVQGDDYINGIWKNYQYFLKFLEVETDKIENVTTHKRSPGTYDSMYRYILLLEDVGMIERYKTEDVPQSEYDFPVPAEFRTRTFIRLSDSFEGNEDIWNNPYGEKYGKPDTTRGEESKPQEPELDDDAVEIDVEPGEPDNTTGLEGFQPEEPTDGTDDSDSSDTSGLGGFDGEEGDSTEEDEDSEDKEFPGFEPDSQPEDVDVEDLPDPASIDDFLDKQAILDLIDSSFPEAISRTFLEAPLPDPPVSEEDFGVGRVAVYGKWAEGEATPGQSALELVVSVTASDADLKPGWVPAGIQEHLGDVMRDNTEYRDVFPNFFIVSVYNSAYKRRVDEVIRNEQKELIYYDLQQEQFKEL